MRPRKSAASAARGRPRAALLVLATIVLGMGVLAATARAGAWTQPKGRTYLRTTVGVYSASQYFDAGGELFEGDWWDPEASVQSTTLRQIVEYGYEEGLTLVFDGEFKSFSADRSGAVESVLDDRVTGLGDAGLGVRYRFRESPIVTSIQVRLEVPGGYDQDRLDYSLGSGDTNGDIRLQFGGALRAKRSNYWSIDLGYRLRGGPIDDDLLYSGAFGLELRRKFWGRVGLSGVSNQGDAVLDVETEADSDPRQGATYTSYGVALGYVLNPTVTVELGTGGELSGKNSFRGNSFEMTLEIRY